MCSDETLHALCLAYADICGLSAGWLPVTSATTVAAAVGTPMALSQPVLSEGDYVKVLSRSCTQAFRAIQGAAWHV